MSWTGDWRQLKKSKVELDASVFSELGMRFLKNWNKPKGMRKYTHEHVKASGTLFLFRYPRENTLMKRSAFMRFNSESSLGKHC